MTSYLALLLLSLVAVAAVVLAYAIKMGRWKFGRRKSRIKILGKDRVIIRRIDTRKCPACRKTLEEASLLARCSVNPAHEIHKACKGLVNGRCPVCGHLLE